MKKKIWICLTVCFIILLLIGTFIVKAYNRPPKITLDDTPRVLNEEELTDLYDDLDSIKVESAAADDNSENAKRIRNKNNCIEEYKNYIESIKNTPMNNAERNECFRHLNSLYVKILLLEPEPTEKEAYQLELYRATYTIIFEIKELEARKMLDNIDSYKEARNEISSIYERLKADEITLEAAKTLYEDYLKYLEENEPKIYRLINFTSSYVSP